MSYIKLSGDAQDLIDKIKFSFSNVNAVKKSDKDNLGQMIVIGWHAIIYEYIKLYILQNNGENKNNENKKETLYLKKDDKYIKSYIIENLKENGSKNHILDYLAKIDDIYFTKTTEDLTNDRFLNSKETFIRFYYSRNNLVHIDRRRENTKDEKGCKLDLKDIERYTPFLIQFIEDLDKYYGDTMK